MCDTKTATEGVTGKANYPLFTIWWERQDSNLRRRKPADLQSAPFATRDTLPNRRIALISKDKRA